MFKVDFVHVCRLLVLKKKRKPNNLVTYQNIFCISFHTKQHFFSLLVKQIRIFTVLSVSCSFYKSCIQENASKNSKVHSDSQCSANTLLHKLHSASENSVLTVIPSKNKTFQKHIKLGRRKKLNRDFFSFLQCNIMLVI